jgi:hypothetical protein
MKDLHKPARNDSFPAMRCARQPARLGGGTFVVWTLPGHTADDGHGCGAAGRRAADAEAVGAENPVTSCDVHVLVDEAAEPVSS